MPILGSIENLRHTKNAYILQLKNFKRARNALNEAYGFYKTNLKDVLIKLGYPSENVIQERRLYFSAEDVTSTKLKNFWKKCRTYNYRINVDDLNREDLHDPACFMIFERQNHYRVIVEKQKHCNTIGTVKWWTIHSSYRDGTVYWDFNNKEILSNFVKYKEAERRSKAAIVIQRAVRKKKCRSKAAIVIQRAVQEWFWQIRYSNGHPGFHFRKAKNSFDSLAMKIDNYQ